MSRSWSPRWLRILLRSRPAAVGLVLLLFFACLALIGPLIWSGDPLAPDYSTPPRQPPSADHWLGTDQQSRDVFLQLVHGARPTLFLGVATGLIATGLAVLVGITAGYVTGRGGDLLALLINVFLVLPTIPLIIVLAAWLRVRSDWPIILVIALTSWAFGARVIRSQVLSLRQRDFVQFAIVRGESRARILFREILPNMTSMIATGVLGTTVYAVGTAAGLQFLGLGNLGGVNWFSLLYWAQNSSSLQTGAWWTFVPPGVAIALFGLACTLVNYGIDEISNPRLGRAPRRRRLPWLPANGDRLPDPAAAR